MESIENKIQYKLLPAKKVEDYSPSYIVLNRKVLSDCKINSHNHKKKWFVYKKVNISRQGSAQIMFNDVRD